MIKTWLTCVSLEEIDIKGVIDTLTPYGFEIDGNQFKEDLKTFAFMGEKEALIQKGVSLWCILVSSEALKTHDTAYGLSMLALSIRAKMGFGFPIVILQTDKEALDVSDLPTAFSGATILSTQDKGFAAKLVARAHEPKKNVFWEYLIDIHGSEHLGQWLEIRPNQADWKGIIFGVDDGEILFQAVGKSGKLPETSVLDYPSKGLKLSVKDRDFMAWALQNEINTDHSYYVKILGYPKTILFGPYSDDEASDVFIVDLVVM